jgi:hypothetical protein
MNLGILSDPVRDENNSAQNHRQRRALRYGRLILAAVLLTAIPVVGRAVPSFARQTGFQCIVCHTEFPILTSFGHQFKLSGYTLSAGQTDLPPIAIMVQPSFTHTARGQPGGAAPHFGDNNNWGLNQASVFYAGRLFGPYASKIMGSDAAAFANKFGVFFQTTYDGTAKTWAWDNAEIRFADATNISGQAVTYGMYLNNNPTMQDVWNSTPAWGFPFSGSGLAPAPAAATLIDGGLAQQVAGLGAYVMIANSLYLDAGAYRTLGSHFQKRVGVDPEGETQIAGLAPYWRIAWEKPAGTNGRWEIGTFGLAASSYPGRDSSEGRDHTVDVGLDAEYQNSAGRNDITALVSWIYENQTWNASQALESTTNRSDKLWNFKASVDYLYDKTYGAALQYFNLYGDRDPLLYADSSQTGSPASDGLIFQLNYLPLNKNGGPSFWPKSNVKFSLQYTLYNRFNGARKNYDGSGRNARDNNTTYLEAWIVF